MDDIVKDFLVESYEGLDQLDRDFVALEVNPDDRELLARIFRCVHTIKGTCGFLGFSRLEAVSHVGENLLVRMRDGDLRLDAEIASALLALVDALREILGNIESTGEEGDGNYDALIHCLQELHDRTASTPSNAPEPVPATPVAAPRFREAERPVGEILIQSGAASPEAVAEALVEQFRGNEHKLGEILVERGAASSAAIAEALEAQGEARKDSALSDSSIRVDVGLLDRLMTLVGELVLARNQIVLHAAVAEQVTFTATSQRLNQITTELQEGVMKTRMQPIGNVWSRFPRVVRDLSTSLGKQIRIEMEGKETELDKTIIEAIKDPLTHIVRNSADHGIEMPAVRVAAGKQAEGRILLRAYHEGGQVIIEITDDGAGVSAERVKKKALERGLVTAEQVARMSEREIQNLLFMPGFSTAEKVTNVSGRGVGMDVVKTNIEKIGGSVDIASTHGAGTTMKIKIPLTLAIIPALVVTTGGDRYAIPQVSLLELVRLEGDEMRKGIEMVHGAPVYRLRGNLLPLVDLNRALGLPAGGETGDVANMVVLQADDRQFGLLVDHINDTEEIVVKPLGRQLKGIPAYAGITIMGDGQVALILDVLGLAQKARVVTETARENRAVAGESHGQAVGDLQTLLLFGLAGGQRMAIPLSLLSRLEEFPLGSVERSGTTDVVQYRGDIMPLLHLGDCIEGAVRERDTGSLQVVVYSHNGRPLGLVVENIIDIVEERLSVTRRSTVGHVSGSAVIQGSVTDLLDIESVIEASGIVIYEHGDMVAAGA
jgi:two-component system chemotaxis sensor kinase CheA